MASHFFHTHCATRGERSEEREQNAWTMCMRVDACVHVCVYVGMRREREKEREKASGNERY